MPNLIRKRPSHIGDVLMYLHPGQWFGWRSGSNKTYADLVIHPTVSGVPVSYDKPSESSLKTALAKAQSDFDASIYYRTRASEYPDIVTFMEAYTEKEIGGDSTKWDAYVTAYNKVRSDNPKPG